MKRLQEELTSSQQHREKLVADIENFSTSITHIDGELTELRASNRRLMDENMELHQNMESMEHLKGVSRLAFVSYHHYWCCCLGIYGHR